MGQEVSTHEGQHILRVTVFAPNRAPLNAGVNSVMGGSEVVERVTAALADHGISASIEWQEIRPVAHTGRKPEEMLKTEYGTER